MELAWNGAVKLTNINNLACLVPAVFHSRAGPEGRDQG